jgi:hypothetical protein
MCDPQQEMLMKHLRRRGGLNRQVWRPAVGEHGKGFRAEYSPAFFGEALYGELRKIKAASTR